MNTRRVSLPLLGLYTLASFLHFAHNGVMLDAYPDMPAWITASGVYATWLGIAATGMTGYVLTRLGWRRLGLIILALYAASGLDGLAHYALAPVTAHSFAMNFTIGFEVVTAILLLIAIGRSLSDSTPRNNLRTLSAHEQGKLDQRRTAGQPDHRSAPGAAAAPELQLPHR